MLKRKNIASLEDFSQEEGVVVGFVLKILDKAEGYRLYIAFFEIYLNKEIITLERLSYKLSISLNTLHHHLRKINRIIQAVKTLKKEKIIEKIKVN